VNAARDDALHQQRLHELCGATLRALAGDSDLHYRGQRLYHGTQTVPVHAPHLALQTQTTQTSPLAQGQAVDLTALRAVMDAVALRLKFSDALLHQSLCPPQAVDRLVFELLEQLRVEASVASHMLGQKHNLLQRFTLWSDAFEHSGLLETTLGLLIFTISQTCWSRLTGHALSDERADRIEGTRYSLAPLIGDALNGLRQHRFDQAAFAPHALTIAQTIGNLVRAESAQRDEAGSDTQANEARALSEFSLLLNFDQEDNDDTVTTLVTGNSKVLEDSEEGYRVFTKRYDREVFAASLVRSEQLKEYRAQLDALVQSQGIHITRLARQLLAILALPERDGWNFGQEDGFLDGRRLAQLISTPSEKRIFKHTRLTPRSDCLVSFLLDCSGSMKAHTETLAVLIDSMARALSMISVQSEVLGFSTHAWNGGRARKDWLTSGKPLHPGRLNEVSHMVFKDADHSWRHARQSISALLKPDIYREGIDGEAVQWAYSRMLSRNVDRRILIVISDGCPMDGATQQANDNYYLDNHLKQVVAQHERQGDVEICGLGVGLDLSAYYSRCLGMDASRKVDHHLLCDILELMAGRHLR
jgi:cobaltochelatase CobT